MTRIASASDAVPIYQNNDFYVPSFALKVGKRNQDQSIIRDITQVSYKDDIESIDSCDFTINNWDADKRTFKYSDTKLFDPGQEVELSMGYLNKGLLRVMLRGEITSLSPNFPSSGQPTLAVSCLNILHRFRKTQISQPYEKKTDSEIAKEICGRLGVPLFPKVPPALETKNDYLLQSSQFDIVFLLGRARRIGYDLVVYETKDESGLYFGPSADLTKVTYRLSYGKSLIQFQPTLSTANQVSKVTVLGWDAKKGAEIKVTKDRSQLKKDALTKEQLAEFEKAFGGREEVISDHPVRNETEAGELALAKLQTISGDMVTGSGSIIGLPDLRAGSVIFIDGLGASRLPPGQGRYDGRYFVTSTTHAIGGSGYTTQFQCRREVAN